MVIVFIVKTCLYILEFPCVLYKFFKSIFTSKSCDPVSALLEAAHGQNERADVYENVGPFRGKRKKRKFDYTGNMSSKRL